MAKQRGGAKKLRRSGRKAAYYTRQHIVTARNKARRALKRKKRQDEIKSILAHIAKPFAAKMKGGAE